MAAKEYLLYTRSLEQMDACHQFIWQQTWKILTSINTLEPIQC